MDESREIHEKFAFRRVGSYFLVMHKKQWMHHEIHEKFGFRRVGDYLVVISLKTIDESREKQENDTMGMTLSDFF